VEIDARSAGQYPHHKGIHKSALGPTGSSFTPATWPTRALCGKSHDLPSLALTPQTIRNHLREGHACKESHGCGQLGNQDRRRSHDSKARGVACGAAVVARRTSSLRWYGETASNGVITVPRRSPELGTNHRGFSCRLAAHLRCVSQAPHVLLVLCKRIAGPPGPKSQGQVGTRNILSAERTEHHNIMEESPDLALKS